MRILIGINDLATLNPELAEEAYDWDPATVTEFSHKKVEWQCALDHTWTAQVSNRSSGRGCPYCANQKVLTGYNDLTTTNPELAAQAHGWDPTTVTEFSHKKVEWKCALNHVWLATTNRRTSGHGCPYCTNRKILAGYNDFATLNPDLAVQAHGWDPTTVTEFSSRKRGWQCEKGHVWDARVKDRSRGNDCPYCAERGFKPELDAHLYFLEHHGLDLYQIGISNKIERRLKEHACFGWEVVEVSSVMPGDHAYNYEQDGRKAIKARDGRFTDLFGNDEAGPRSEVWTRESFCLKSLAELFAMVDEDRSKFRDEQRKYT